MAKEKKTPEFIVLKPFRDRKQYGDTFYNVGDDVSHFDAERIETLKTRNMVGSPANTETEE